MILTEALIQGSFQSNFDSIIEVLQAKLLEEINANGITANYSEISAAIKEQCVMKSMMKTTTSHMSLCHPKSVLTMECTPTKINDTTPIAIDTRKSSSILCTTYSSSSISKKACGDSEIKVSPW